MVLFADEEYGVPLVEVHLFALFLPFGGGERADVLRGQREVTGDADHGVGL